MTAVSSVYAQRLLLTLFLISFGIYLFLATVTYTPFDPGWMHISSDTQQVSNASGVAGAWIADLLFGFLGWGSLLIPLFLFIEAIQVWWPHSFLNRPFRYAAEFFLILTSSALLYLHWNLPADTLDNAAGGIIGYELGQSLTQLLTIYGATLFLLIFWFAFLTLAFGIYWNKTWDTIRSIPAYLQDIFYKNVPTNESAYDRTLVNSDHLRTNEQFSPTSLKSDQPAEQAVTNGDDHLSNSNTSGKNTSQSYVQTTKHDDIAERLFADVVAKEKQAMQIVETIDDEELEHTIEKAHQLQRDSQRTVATGEVWRALQKDDVSHKQEIDALLRAAEDEPTKPISHLNVQQLNSSKEYNQTPQDFAQTSSIDWDDDLIFDELLEAVPAEKNQNDSFLDFPEDEQQSRQNTSVSINNQYQKKDIPQGDQTPPQHPSTKNILIETELDDFSDLLIDDEDQVFHRSLEKSSASTRSESLSKDEFLEAWQETTETPPISEQLDPNDDLDFDAPLTDLAGRPMSRAMQVVQKRRDLPPLPGLELLDKVDPNKKVNFTEEQLLRLSELLEIKLQEFNVKAQVVEAQPGPVVTRFELELAPGVKASKVTNISRDLARSMSMASVRVVEVIPGKPYIGIEVPNSTREMVRLIELIDTPAYRDPQASITMAMGKDISGRPVLADLAKAPHMLVAGTTGSGKSVAVNSMLLTMLLKYTPDQLRLILIDPKQLELANYNDIPHLLTPVVTDMKDAVNALNWCVNEMERRYKLMSYLKIRKITDYNRKVEEAIMNGEDLIDPTWKPSDSATQERAPRLQSLPMIVIVADEFADMIMQVGKKAEEMITRLAQKSRAAGIHLLLATQRPSVDVITGLIKANIPTRVALRVNSKIDSRTILDAGGAEDLLGHGDMLFLGPGKIEPERVHGAFISDDEVNRICDAWRERGDPDYIDEILTPFDEEPVARSFDDGEGGQDRDMLYDDCVAFVLETRKASTSSLQRKFSLGYNRAARIIDQMEENGIVSAMGPNGKRDILV